MDLPTFDELFRVARDEALARNAGLTREIIEREGSDANAIYASCTAVGEEVVTQIGEAQASLFLASARGQKLDRLIFDRFGLIRKSAAPAVGTVEFSTVTANPASFSIPINTKLQTVDGRVYVTATEVTFPAGSTGPVSVAVRSLISGLGQQAKDGTITSIISQITGSPTDLTVTNSLATAGASDEESDESFVARARLFYPSVRRGTIGAILAGVLAVEGVESAAVFEALDASGRPARFVQAVIADKFTESLLGISPTPSAYATQSQVLAGRVVSGLDDVRAAGIAVSVQVARVFIQPITLGLRFFAGADIEQASLAARALVVEYVNSLAPSQPLNPAGIVSKLRSVAGLDVTGQEVISPSGIVTVPTLGVLRTTLGKVVNVSLTPTAALQNSTNPDTVG